ncbi:hypothetical protein VCHE16_2398, partial [Vibrio paracholerae HE-16]
MINHWLFCFSF